MPNLIRSTLIYGIGGALGRAISILTVPLLTFYLIPEDFGVIAMLLMLGALLTPVFSLGLGTSIGITYFDVGAGQKEKDSILWTAFLLLIISALALVLFTWFMKEEISRFFFDTQSYSFTIFIALTAASLSIPLQVWQLGLQFRNKAMAYMASSFLTSLISAGLILYFVIYIDQSVSAYFEALLIGQIVTLVLFMLVGSYGCRFGFSGNIARKMLVYGAPMIASFFFLFVIQNGVRYPLEYFSGLADVGIYMIGTSFGMVMSIFTNAFSTAWTPYALSFSDKHKEACDILPKVTFMFLVLGGVGVMLFFYFAKPALLAFTANDYHEAYLVVGFAAACQFLTTYFAMLLPPLYYGKKVYLVTYVQAISALIAIVLYIGMIPIWGIVGAAFAVLLGHVAIVLLQLIVIKRDRELLQLPYKHGLDIKLFSVLSILCGISFINPSDNLLGSLYFAISGFLISMMVLIILFKEEFKPVIPLVNKFFKGRLNELK